MTKRLELIESLIDDDAKVIDIGTDHAYLPIMLAKKNIKCLGTDINKMALRGALKNIQKYHLEDKIDLVLTDGLEGINVSEFNTLVIAGMGYQTIKHILNEQAKLESIKTIIIQSNNDYELVRKLLNDLEYKISEEKIIEDKKDLYHIFKFLKGKEVLTKEEILMGKKNIEYQMYYQQDLEKLQKILNNIPNEYEEERIKIMEKIKILEKYCQK